MFAKMRLAVVFAFVGCLLIGATNAGASGQTCKNVKIKIANKTTWKEIKVEKLWYWDNDIKDWRQELTWTVLWIPVNETRTRTRNLEHVDNEMTRIKIRWGRHDSVRMIDRYEESEAFNCQGGCEVNIEIKG